MVKLSDILDAGRALLIIWSISGLFWVVWSRHLALRRPLHARRMRMRNTRRWPQAWAQASRLVKGRAQGTLVLGHRVRVKMMRWWGTMLRETSRKWMV